MRTPTPDILRLLEVSPIASSPLSRGEGDGGHCSRSDAIPAGGVGAGAVFLKCHAVTLHTWDRVRYAMGRRHPHQDPQAPRPPPPRLRLALIAAEKNGQFITIRPTKSDNYPNKKPGSPRANSQRTHNLTFTTITYCPRAAGASPPGMRRALPLRHRSSQGAGASQTPLSALQILCGCGCG